MARSDSWHRPLLLMALLLCLGFAEACKSRQSAPPPLSQYTIVVQPGRALEIEPLSGSSQGRISVIPGPNVLILLVAKQGGNLLGHSGESTWSIAFEVPAKAFAEGKTISTDNVRAVARAAGKEVVYYSRKVTGTMHIDKATTKAVKGSMHVQFNEPSRDEGKVGALALEGGFDAQVGM